MSECVPVLLSDLNSVRLLFLPRSLNSDLVCRRPFPSVRGVSWSEVATVPKRKSHRGLDLDLSLNSEVNIWKGWKENSGTK